MDVPIGHDPQVRDSILTATDVEGGQLRAEFVRQRCLTDVDHEVLFDYAVLGSSRSRVHDAAVNRSVASAGGFELNFNRRVVKPDEVVCGCEVSAVASNPFRLLASRPEPLDELDLMLVRLFPMGVDSERR